MLLELLKQGIGILVLLSCLSTLILYVRFKRHQKNTVGLSYSNVSNYMGCVLTVVYIFGSYSTSLRQRIHFIRHGQVEMKTILIETNNQIMIDARPFSMCIENKSFGKWDKCLLIQPEKVYFSNDGLRRPTLAANKPLELS